jgi:hypothetical protein
MVLAGAKARPTEIFLLLREPTAHERLLEKMCRGAGHLRFTNPDA